MFNLRLTFETPSMFADVAGILISFRSSFSVISLLEDERLG